MRMLPSRYLQGKPLTIKKMVSRIQHLSAPLKGLSLDSKLIQGDPLLAPILDNWSVDEFQIRVRPGTKLVQTLPSAAAISAIIPYEGLAPSHLLAADLKLYAPDNAVLGDTFGSDDWDWTAFSNLGELDYTIMVNGHDGVWSWDGGNLTDPAPVAATNLSKIEPGGDHRRARLTSANSRMARSSLSSGATGTGLTNANGDHVISNVGSPVEHLHPARRRHLFRRGAADDRRCRQSARQHSEGAGHCAGRRAVGQPDAVRQDLVAHEPAVVRRLGQPGGLLFAFAVEGRRAEVPADERHLQAWRADRGDRHLDHGWRPRDG